MPQGGDMTATVTSINAYHQPIYQAVKQRQVDMILAYIDKTGSCYTRGELAYILGMEKSTMSARVNQLIADGLLLEFGIRKCTRSNRMCKTVCKMRDGA